MTLETFGAEVLASGLHAVGVAEHAPGLYTAGIRHGGRRWGVGYSDRSDLPLPWRLIDLDGDRTTTTYGSIREIVRRLTAEYPNG